MIGRGTSSVQRSRQAPRATVSSAETKWSSASRPLWIAKAAAANSSDRVGRFGRWLSKCGAARPLAASASAWLTG
jgi:hypothetical protein